MRGGKPAKRAGGSTASRPHTSPRFLRRRGLHGPFDYSAAKAVWAAGQKAAERETKSIEGGQSAG